MKIPEGHRCADIGEFNAWLLRWLTTSDDTTVGVGVSRDWLHVPIDGLECRLAADTTRAGVEAYLSAVLADPSPDYSVVASSKGVIERISVGTSRKRIRGFYLYTPSPLAADRALRPFDPPLDLVDVGLLVLAAVQHLHESGHQRLRILPGLSGSGMHWRVSVTYPHNFVEMPWGLALRDHDESFIWSTGEGFRVSGHEVGRWSSPAEVASMLEPSLRMGHASGEDQPYAAWFAGLVAVAGRLRRLPIAYADYEELRTHWMLDGDCRYLAPPT